jgi:hypothetical protein
MPQIVIIELKWLGFFAYASFGFGTTGMDRAHQIRPPREIWAQTDQRCPSYGPSKLSKIWLFVLIFNRSLFLPNDLKNWDYIERMCNFSVIEFWLNAKNLFISNLLKNPKTTFFEKSR